MLGWKMTALFLGFCILLIPFATADDAIPYKDPSLSVEERVNDFISHMTLEEKAISLYHNSPGVERLGLPCWDGWNQCIHGVFSNEIGTTCFPISTAQAATWNPELIYEVADAIAEEGRALFNARVKGLHANLPHGLMFRSPVINILRNPYWGRIQEAYSEDPVLCGRIGVAFVRGLNGDHPKYLKAASTLKHYAVNNVEQGRFSHSAEVSEKMLHEYWLPHFRDCVVEGKVQSIMAAYNAINDVPCVVDQMLLTEILRDRWGYRGFVVSDLGGIGTMIESHKNTNDPTVAISLALKAGCDYSDEQFRDSLVNAVKENMVSEERVNEALQRVLRVPFMLGVMDPPEMDNPYNNIGLTVIDSPKHRELAKRVEQEAIVLLKNDGNFLPLTEEKLKKFKTIAIIGPAAMTPSYGNYYNKSAPRVSPYDALVDFVRSQEGMNILYARGGDFLPNPRDNNYERNAKRNLEYAEGVARRADLVLLFLGSTGAIEDEGRDRTTLKLPKSQQDLLETVAKANPNTVLLYAGAGPSSMRFALDNLPAILYVWYPGEEGGNAILDILLGKVNPAGRLPYTVYENDADVPNVHEYDVSKGFTYMYLKKKPMYPFGFGLSYTTFLYSNLHAGEPEAAPGSMKKVTYQVNVKNTGTVAGDEVVQLYVKNLRPPKVGIVNPIHQLRAFKRVSLKPGETKTVTLTIEGGSPVMEFDEEIHDFRHYWDKCEIQVGASSDDIRLRLTQ